MRRRVTEYLPEYLKEIRELYVIAEVFDYYIERIYNAVINGVYEKLISRASEERIVKWENLLKIAPAATLEERRKFLKSMMRKNRKLDEETIKGIVQVITGGKVYVDFFDSTLIIRVKNAENPGGFNEVRRVLEKVIPAHLDLDIRTFYPNWNDVKKSYSSWQDVYLISNWRGLYNEAV